MLSKIHAQARARDVVVVAQFAADGAESNDRFIDIAEHLARSGYRVELVTSDFSHLKKTRRACTCDHRGFTHTEIHEPGYKANVSLRRIISHRIMAKNISKYLAIRSTPDLIYCAVPSLAVGSTLSRYCSRTGVPFVIDVQDLWPEAFAMVLPQRRLTALLLAPFRWSANRVYRSADAVVAVSRTFADRVVSVQEKRTPTEVVYLGTDLEKFDQYSKGAMALGGWQHDGELRVVYLGTHGHSYDLPLVCNAIALASSSSTMKLRLVTMGGGPKWEEYRRYALDLGISATFLGRLPYPEMVATLAHCQVAVNPIRIGSAGSVINKVADYAAAALPVANTQENSEYRELLDRWEAGKNVKPGDADDLATTISTLAADPGLRERLGRNNRRLAEQYFDRRRTYARIVDLVRRLDNANR